MLVEETIRFFTSKLSVDGQKLKVVNTGESNCAVINMIDLGLSLLNVFSVGVCVHVCIYIGMYIYI